MYFRRMLAAAGDFSIINHNSTGRFINSRTNRVDEIAINTSLKLRDVLDKNFARNPS